MTSTDTTIADLAAAASRAAQDRLPAEVNAGFEAERTRLIELGVPADAARAGTAMPDGDLLDAHGNPTTLAEVRNGRPAVVVFYRGAWCPYCNLTLRAYQKALVGQLEERGVALVAVSPQKPDGSLTVMEKNELEYAVVSDPGLQIARKLGIVFTLGQSARDGQSTLGLDLTAVNADGTYDLPLATTILIDTQGVIRWIDVHPDYTTRSEPAEILAAVDAL